MNGSNTKKVYGKVSRASECTILIDPLFGSKIECKVDESMQDKIPETQENINVIITDEPNPRVVEFLYSNKEESPVIQEVSVSTKDKELAGPTLFVRGRVLSDQLSDVGGGKVGTITLQLPHMKLELLYGRKSRGVIPPVSTMATVEVFDGKMPKIVSISGQTNEPKDVPHYIPIPEEGELRWPLMCMECGSTDISRLVHKADTYNKVFDTKTPEWGEFLGRVGASYLLGGAIGALVGAAGGFRPKYTVYYVNLIIKKYLCKDCEKKNRKFENLLEITVTPWQTTNPVYTIKFKNKEYERIFKHFNKEPYLGVIRAR